MPYVVDRMRTADIPAVMEVERESFAAVWPATAYRREILDNKLAHYVVLREMSDEVIRQEAEPAQLAATVELPPPGGFRGLVSTLREWVTGGKAEGDSPPARPGRIVGYLGLWMMVDEAHITTVAVSASERGKGLGELLLVAACEMALLLGARVVTLEVRFSNSVAQNLYEKFGFVKVGRRPRYYSDNNEDALIMTSPDITSTAFRSRLAQIRRRNRERLPEVIWRQ